MEIRSKQPASSAAVRAFTLVEVLVAMGIFGMSAVAFYAGISWGFGVIQVARENLRSTQILAEKMDTIRLYTFEQISSNNFVPPTFVSAYFGPTNGGGLLYTGAVTIAAFNLPNPPTYSNDLRVVTVDLSWISGGVPRSRSMSTLVARNGLQTYIY
jgi:prepilin-type N-terminal cleavage/methylation domain-containing protein